MTFATFLKIVSPRFPRLFENTDSTTTVTINLQVIMFWLEIWIEIINQSNRIIIPKLRLKHSIAFDICLYVAQALPCSKDN
jgi:hypothetical protein